MLLPRPVTAGFASLMIYEFTTDNTWVIVAHTVHNHEPNVKHPSAGQHVNSVFQYAAAPDVLVEILPFLDWLLSIGIKGTMLTTQLQKACLTKGIISTFTSQSICNLAWLPVGQYNLDSTNLSAWISKCRTEQLNKLCTVILMCHTDSFSMLSSLSRGDKRCGLSRAGAGIPFLLTQHT